MRNGDSAAAVHLASLGELFRTPLEPLYGRRLEEIEILLGIFCRRFWQAWIIFSLSLILAESFRTPAVEYFKQAIKQKCNTPYLS